MTKTTAFLVAALLATQTASQTVEESRTCGYGERTSYTTSEWRNMCPLTPKNCELWEGLLGYYDEGELAKGCPDLSGIDKPEGDDALSPFHMRHLAKERGLKITTNYDFGYDGGYSIHLWLSDDKYVEMMIAMVEDEIPRQEVLDLRAAMRLFIMAQPTTEVVCADLRAGEWWVDHTADEMERECPSQKGVGQ